MKRYELITRERKVTDYGLTVEVNEIIDYQKGDSSFEVHTYDKRGFNSRTCPNYEVALERASRYFR